MGRAPAEENTPSDSLSCPHAGGTKNKARSNHRHPSTAPVHDHHVPTAMNAPPRLLKLHAFKARSPVTRPQSAAALTWRTFWSAPLPNLGLLLHQTLFRTFSFLRGRKHVGRLPTSKDKCLVNFLSTKTSSQSRVKGNHRAQKSTQLCCPPPPPRHRFHPLGGGALACQCAGFLEEGTPERKKKKKRF